MTLIQQAGETSPKTAGVRSRRRRAASLDVRSPSCTRCKRCKCARSSLEPEQASRLWPDSRVQMIVQNRPRSYVPRVHAPFACSRRLRSRRPASRRRRSRGCAGTGSRPRRRTGPAGRRQRGDSERDSQRRERAQEREFEHVPALLREWRRSNAPAVRGIPPRGLCGKTDRKPISVPPPNWAPGTGTGASAARRPHGPINEEGATQKQPGA
jgi:hypothetical protein